MLDDDPRELDKLSRLISAYYAKQLRIELPPQNICRFRSGTAALDYISRGTAPDIAFLDIIMPEMTGVQFAERIRNNGYRGYVVFLTSANDFASESFMVGAFSYLLKPVGEERLFSTLQKIEEDMVRTQLEDSASILVQTRQYSREILLREILFAEVMGRKLSIHLITGETVTFNKPLKEFAPELLAHKRFSTCHNSIIANMDHVENIRENDAVMRTGPVIPISRRYREFKSRYISYMLHKPGNIK